MKRYQKRQKTIQVSKNKLARQLQAWQRLARQSSQSAELERQRAMNTSLLLHAEIRHRCELEEKLEKVTESVWQHASVRYEPEQDWTDARRSERWSIEGRAAIGLKVDFRKVKSLPRGSRQAFLMQLVDNFAHKAREHALANFKVLLD